MSDSGSVSNSQDDIFRNAVLEWVRLNDECIELRKQVAVRNKRKKVLDEVIIPFMKDQNKEFVQIGEHGGISVKETKTSLSLKKDYVADLLSKFLNDAELALRCTEHIFENKEVKYNNSVKRINRQLQT